MIEVPPICIDVTVERMRQTLKHHIGNMLDPVKVQQAIDRAFSQFDIYTEIEKQAAREIREVIAGGVVGLSYPLQDAIRKATEERVRQLIQPIVDRIVQTKEEPTDGR